ncbi:FG-GAP-like repeat-containing protein [Moheibacter sediminis]|uniref:Por secretion system C-terminal sorting domain-containing protein n=1 Tax=Moheibacter sediminis TaxID=1434700 RepID=A0A1W1ZW23_9FLAO|nr:FG-GAP-like repeat-containing protein [Moheibacter sediminis]SMC52614.1 Por secretion system C-terminal sorting domain-containing protein [Moheibacter sediminis]
MKNFYLLLMFASFSLNGQITFTSQNVPADGTYKMCVVDMNGDFLDDIVSVSSNKIHVLFQNEDGTFTSQNFPTSNVLYLPGWSLAAGDFNGDGYNDLLYGSSQGVTFMLTQVNGMNVSYSTHAGNQYVFAQRSNFIDIDNDGNLDAYVCHDTEPSVYYTNENNSPVFHQGGLGDYPSGGHYGSIWIDYNNDGKQDLYIAKCGGEEERRRNELYRNNGNGTFTNVAGEANLDSTSEQWSSAWGDFNNDGWMDVFNGKNAQMGGQGSHELMVNNGDGTFTNVTAGSGFDIYNGTSREHFTYDFNNDGYLDIAGNGNKIFINNGDMTFTPINAPFSDASIGDLNNDGFLDAYAFGWVYYNSGNSNNWLKINTIGTESNLNGIGARVELYSELGMQIRDVRSGEGFSFMSTLNTHFGIGTDAEIDKVIVRWPSGIVDTIENPEINSTLVIVEGESILGVNDTAAEKISIYPNPVKDILYVQGKSLNGSNVEIFHLTGSLVLKSKLTDNKVNVSNLAKGIYVISVENQGKKTTMKFIKQ